jgi:REP element-mobilizing transposase RayT
VIIPGVTPARFREISIRDRGRLPHWEKAIAAYFVTFRLADSLPKAVLQKLAERKRMLVKAQHSGRQLLPDEKAALAELGARRVEELLDMGGGCCWLREARVASMVANAIGFWDPTRYHLFAWCVMPNHVHVLFRSLPEYRLAKVVGAWKSYTAKVANRILERKGNFWEREYYDRLIRDSAEFGRALDYVKTNPERAGLKQWEWVWCADGWN